MKYILLLFLLMGCGDDAPKEKQKEVVYSAGNCYSTYPTSKKVIKVLKITETESDRTVVFRYSDYPFDEKLDYRHITYYNNPRKCDLYDEGQSKVKNEKRLKTLESKIKKLEEFQKRVDDLENVTGE